MLTKKAVLILNFFFIFVLTFSLFKTFSFASNCFFDSCKSNKNNDIVTYKNVLVNDKGLSMKIGSKISYKIKNAERIIVKFTSKDSPAVFKSGAGFSISPEIQSKDEIIYSEGGWDVFCFNGEVYGEARSGEIYKQIKGFDKNLVKCDGDYNFNSYYVLNVDQKSSNSPVGLAKKISSKTVAIADSNLITTFETEVEFKINSNADEIEIMVNNPNGVTIKSVLINGINIKTEDNLSQNENHPTNNSDFDLQNQESSQNSVIEKNENSSNDFNNQDFESFESIGESDFESGDLMEETKNSQKHQKQKSSSKNKTSEVKGGTKFKPKPPKTPKSSYSSGQKFSGKYSNRRKVPETKQEDDSTDVIDFNSDKIKDNKFSDLIFIFSLVIVSFMAGRTLFK